jgi:hypothetical protein
MRVTIEREAVGKIVGTGRVLEGRVVTNHDLEKVVDTDDAWIVARTEILERRFVQEAEDCVTLATQVSKEALERSGLSGNLEGRGYQVKEVNETTRYYMRIARCFPNTTVLTGFLATGT